MKRELKSRISLEEIAIFKEMYAQGEDISYISVVTGRSCFWIRTHLGIPDPEPLYS